jgi:hypothetical protein
MSRSMFRSSSRPKVIPIAHEPVRVAKPPRYPGYVDPRPTDVSGGETASSLARTLLSHATALSLGVALPSLGACQAHAGSGASSTSAVKGKGQNPFSAKRGGFPIHPIHFGTGDPARLSEKDARPLIEKLLAQAGLALAKDVDPSLKGISVKLDGWDAKRKVGFEYLDWSDYEFTKKQSHRAVGPSPTGLSFVEIKKLDRLAATGKAYVAAINHRRYAYGPFAHHQDPAYRKKAAEVRKLKDPALRQRGQAELQALGKQLTSQGKAPALRRLERDVKLFIAWLRGQGVI